MQSMSDVTPETGEPMIPFMIRALIEAWREQAPVPFSPTLREYVVTPDKWKGMRTRNPDRIERIVVHQTATPFGVSKRQLKAAGGDWGVAHRRRFAVTPYHYVLTLQGELLVVHPIHRWTYHAGPANRTSIGVAFEGRFPGSEDRRGPRDTTVTLGVLAAWRAHWTRILERHPGLDVVTHRQVTRRRLADPGEWIMRNVIQGQRVDPTWTMGSGKPIPREWKT